MKNICLRFSILLLVFSTIASGVLGVWYVYQTYTVIPAYQKKLLSIAQQRVRDVDAYLSQKKEYLRSLAHEIKIIEFMQNPQEEKTIQSFIQSHEITSRFENIILIKPDGNVIFSNKDPKKFKINVTDYAYRSMSLFLSFDRTIKTMTTDVAVFSFDMLLKIPTLYASMPIFNAEKVFIGVISAQFHVDELYTIINNYFDLGKTGDIFIVKQVKNGAQIIAPTRNDPHSSFTIIEFQGKNVVIPLERAVQGQDGATTTLDHQGQKVVAAWSYIPLLAWGIAITINYDEASEPIRSAYRWWFTSLLFIFAIIMLIVILQWQRITQWTKTHIVKHPINLVICALIIMLIIGTSYLVYRYRNLRNEAITQAHQQAEQKVAYTVQQLQQELQNIKQRALAIAEDLSKDRLKKEDIAIRMRRDIKENPYLSGLIVVFEPYQFSEKQKLYAPHCVRFNGDYKSEQLETALNYTKGENDKEKIIVSWYQIALKRATWLKPVKDRLTGKLVARYAAPFYKKGDSTRAIGVVVAEFALDSFKPFLQKMNVGKTGYAFIIDTVGTFIYHPKNSLVIKEKTIFDYAQQQINKPLHDIGIKIIRGTKGPFSYTDPLANSRIWLHSAPISQSPWLLVLSFIEEEVTISPTIVRHAYMGILSAFIMIILLLVLLICHIFVTRKILLKVAAFSMGVILLCGLAGLWYIIAQTELQADKTTGDARINNTTMLTAYLEERQREASIKYQHIYTIPTGILIDSLNLDDVKSISFSGYIWQQYDTSVPIDRQITIPGATALSVEKVYEETFGNRVIIGWKVIATIPQRLRYAQYPFDHQDIVIPLSHPEQTKLLLLTPDFDEYEKIGFEKFIGIKRGFSLTEFSLVDTYFTYNSSEQPKPTLNQVTGKNLDLFYTISLTRNILHSFIVYFIPLFVILFTLFAAFVFTKVTDTITSFAIGPYTAPTFALIILHANLRNKFTVGDILYIEYLFFLTYLTILLAIIFNIFIGWQKKKSEKLLFFSSLLKLFFWPVQFALWYGATVISFY